MADVSVTFAVGSEQATVVLPVDLPTGGETILTGDIGGLVAAGTVARLRGNCRLIDNLHVRGTLLCDPTGVDLDGQNLFDIHTHDGTLNLVGEEKTAWCRWGDTPVGWQTGDRLAVAPTKVGVYVPTETTWQGTWAATTRPANSPDVTLLDGSTARPEVVNLSQSVTLRNLKRIMIHEASAPNPQTFKWIRVLDSGEPLILGNYPIHFHMIGDHARGSLLEGVVVEGGRNHAYVPHASHGITYRGCVAYKTFSDAYWWDRRPPGVNGPAALVNDTDDTDWDHCLALWVLSTPGGGIEQRLTGFMLGDGDGNRIADTVSSCVQGGDSAAGFHWPEGADGVWGSQRMVAHNNKSSGIRVWQNGSTPGHDVLDFVGFRNGVAGISHGAYKNTYKYRRPILQENGVRAMGVSALSSNASPDDRLLFEDVLTDGPLRIAGHNQPTTNPTVYRRVDHFTQVILAELTEEVGGFYWFEDCNLAPADFDMSGVKPESVVEIFEGGVLVHRWANGVWS